MREPRNPFRLRASEHIESDATFVRLFEPSMLELLPEDGLWDKPQILRSAPGAGKTSLLRLFTPSALMNLHALRTHEDARELYQKLSSLAAVDEFGPRVLGVLLSCARNYATLEDLDCDPARKTRLFFGLLNARILLAALRGALAIRRLAYPQDLDRIELRASIAQVAPPLAKPWANGRELHDWATDLEARVCDAIDSFGPFEAESMPGHDTLSSLLILKEGGLQIDGHAVADRLLVMLDDVHRLTRNQRTILLQSIIDLRSSASVWIAERFEALSTGEMLSVGATKGRDFGEEILLERFWRKSSKRFEHLLLNVADRRARAALDGEISSLAACLPDSLEGPEWVDMHAEAQRHIEARVRDLAGRSGKFSDWVSAKHLREGTAREMALSWRSLEILVERESRRTQQSFDFALPADELEEKDDSAVRVAAELFLSDEFGLPFYFGPSRLASLASSNIEQFLHLAGDEFEELIAAAILKRAPLLTADRQQTIVRQASTALWEDIPRRVRRGRDVKGFIDSVGRFCRSMTYQPNAPYAPGVTGIAILMSDRERLQYSSHDTNSEYSRLADTLASSLAHNLIEATLDYRCKGSSWMVLYLNRLLCAHYGLPLQYGGFKEKTLKQLGSWIEPGFRVARKGDVLL